MENNSNKNSSINESILVRILKAGDIFKYLDMIAITIFLTSSRVLLNFRGLLLYYYEIILFIYLN